MNHYIALQRKGDGKWDYTCNGRACGYCRKYEPIPEDAKYLPLEDIKRHNEKMVILAVNFHADGHATEEEACECFKKYMLDTSLHLMLEEPKNATQQFKCKICDKWTACHASVGPYRMFDLCPEHQNRESVEKLYSVGESWES